MAKPKSGGERIRRGFANGASEREIFSCNSSARTREFEQKKPLMVKPIAAESA